MELGPELVPEQSEVHLNSGERGAGEEQVTDRLRGDLRARGDVPGSRNVDCGDPKLT